MSFALNRLGAAALRGTFRIRPRRAAVPVRPTTCHFHQSHLQRDDKARQPQASNAPVKPSESEQRSSQESVRVKDTTEKGDPIDPSPPEPEPEVDRGATNGLSTTSFDEPDDDEHNDDDNNDDDNDNDFDAFDAGDISPEDEARFRQMLEDPPAKDADAVRQWKEMLDHEGKEMEESLEEVDMVDIEEPDDKRKSKNGLMSLGEEEDGVEDDEQFEGDDITSLAHGELEQHRELREYARIAAWEMPLLRKFAKPFEPPKDAPLRFRYTSYMGETHPAEKKVVVEFCTADLPLTPEQRLKFVKLVGARYNPQKDLVKMSCEMHSTIAQNKRYLGDLVGTLMATARGEGDMEGAKDDFKDVPVDFRHVRWRRKLEFPEQWKLTDERRQQLAEARKRRELGDKERMAQGRMIEGLGIIDQSLRASMAVPSRQRLAGIAQRKSTTRVSTRTLKT